MAFTMTALSDLDAVAHYPVHGHGHNPPLTHPHSRHPQPRPKKVTLVHGAGSVSVRVRRIVLHPVFFFTAFASFRQLKKTPSPPGQRFEFHWANCSVAGYPKKRC